MRGRFLAGGKTLGRVRPHAHLMTALGTDAAVASSSWTMLNYGSVVQNEGVAYSSGVCTLPFQGYYQCSLSGYFLRSSGSWNQGVLLYVGIWKNGAVDHHNFKPVSLSGASHYVHVHFGLLLKCNAGDTLQPACFQADGVAATLVAHPYHTLFTVTALNEQRGGQ